jgi:hypothetical protein
VRCRRQVGGSWGERMQWRRVAGDPAVVQGMQQVAQCPAEGRWVGACLARDNSCTTPYLNTSRLRFCAQRAVRCAVLDMLHIMLCCVVLCMLCRAALLQGDTTALALLMDRNFDLRRWGVCVSSRCQPHHMVCSTYSSNNNATTMHFVVASGCFLA